MKQRKISLRQKLSRLFKPQLKPYLVDEKYKVVPAFSIGGEDYFMFDSEMEIPTGRFFAAMRVYTEMEMSVDKDYLESHTRAVEKILSDPKKISIELIARLNINLKERLELMPLPDFIYKLASVIFFDKTESLYAYDYDYEAIKIKRWKAAGGALDFFSLIPLKVLIPSLNMPDQDSLTYLKTKELISEAHHKLLINTLSDEK